MRILSDKKYRKNMDAQEIDSSLDEELSELVADAGNDMEAVSETVESQEPKKRGRKPIPA